MPALSLKRQGSPLADPQNQLAVLEPTDCVNIPSFDATLIQQGIPRLQANQVQILQINVGKLCNQVCRHCHVDAGPDRREIMTRDTFEACLNALRGSAIQTVDLTGGAPEMNPHFEWFIREVRSLGRTIIDRCNLTILTAPGFTHLPEFLAEQGVEVVASLPCYLEENCDSQRGDGVFQKSIEGIRRLNEVGYGQSGSALQLSLVYNPTGPSLPPNQGKLEAAYREQLRSRFGIEFNRLFAITNMPISRFLDDLLITGQYEAYMRKLVDAFNPAVVDHLMCRTTLSVDWQGHLYDCDFNQMLNLKVAPGTPCHIKDFDPVLFADREIMTGRHCYGCTAGAGSSCQGAVIQEACS